MDIAWTHKAESIYTRHTLRVNEIFSFLLLVHSLPPVKTSPTPEFLTNIYYSSKKPKEDSNYQISPAISTHFDAVDSRKPSYFDMTPDAIRNAIKRPYHNRPYSNDPPIEIIPSSQFFREKGKMKDIAAVIKPPEMSDDLVKAALPPQIASVPQLSYPTQQLIQVNSKPVPFLCLLRSLCCQYYFLESKQF